MTDIHPIHDAADYERALAEINALIQQNPDGQSPDAERLELLSLLVSDYEAKHNPIQPPMPNLTPLELIALRLLNRGLTSAQVAARLDISPTLTRKHVAAVYAKLHVNNRVDAIRAAVALDLIAPIEQIPAKTITNSDTIITNCDSVR